MIALLVEHVFNNDTEISHSCFPMYSLLTRIRNVQPPVDYLS